VVRADLIHASSLRQVASRRTGRALSEELEFVGVSPVATVPGGSDGWHQPDVNVIVHDVDPAQRQMLHALMDIDVPDRDRLGFLGG
jgi:hypothetical protein